MGGSDGRKYSHCCVLVCDHVCMVDNKVSEETTNAFFKLNSTTQMKAVVSYDTLEQIHNTNHIHHTQDHVLKIHKSPTVACDRNRSHKSDEHHLLVRVIYSCSM